MTSRITATIGFVTAVSIPPLHLALSALPDEPDVNGIADGAVFLVVAYVVFLPYSLFAGAVVGIPSFLICKRLDVDSWWMAIVIGSIAGFLITVIAPEVYALHIRILLYGVLGAISGMVFWAIYRSANK